MTAGTAGKDGAAKDVDEANTESGESGSPVAEAGLFVDPGAKADRA